MITIYISVPQYCEEFPIKLGCTIGQQHRYCESCFSWEFYQDCMAENLSTALNEPITREVR